MAGDESPGAGVLGAAVGAVEGGGRAEGAGGPGGPPVITDDMLHTVLRRRAGGESVEQIQPDLIISTGKRKGRIPSVDSIYRALAEPAQREAYPEAVEAAHADFAVLQSAARVGGGSGALVAALGSGV